MIASAAPYTPEEMMTVAAARLLKNDEVYFVGIGLPLAACNLARLTHAPDMTLVCESGTIGTKPTVLPLSIGDGELCDTALMTVSVPEVFRYWLQGRRIDVGVLGGAQIDRFANLNTTVIGPYGTPKVRLPGGGGAPEIASSCREVFILMAQSRRAFVDRVDFVTTFGHGTGGEDRARRGIQTKGPTRLVTDLCIFEPDPETRELTVASVHAGVTRDQIQDNTGWTVRFASQVAETPPPSTQELEVLRDLHARTKAARGID
jgi:glutaconate CoA-transferase, subunit B